MMKLVIFSDLDGTLLDDRTYTFDPAKEALNRLKDAGIPLVLNSSKTAAEIIHYRHLMSNKHPFVSENGGGIFIPKGYFKEGPFWIDMEEKDGYDIIVQGTPYQELRKALEELKGKGFDIRGFSDISSEELSDLTGLTEDEAVMAKERDFDEPVIMGKDVDISLLKRAIRGIGLKYTSGKYLHIIGDNDKGKAVKDLGNLYTKNHGIITTVGIGDGVNDIPMFLNVDIPIVVRKSDGSHDETVMEEVIKIRMSRGIGPKGFNEEINRVIDEYQM